MTERSVMYEVSVDWPMHQMSGGGHRFAAPKDAARETRRLIKLGYGSLFCPIVTRKIKFYTSFTETVVVSMVDDRPFKAVRP